MIDRSTAPPLQAISSFEIPKADRITLSNGIKVFLIESGDIEITAIDILVCTGNLEKRKAGLSAFSNKFILEGSRRMDAKAIAEQIDNKGAHLDFHHHYQYSGVTLYCLNKHLGEMASLLKEMLFHPVYPEKEIRAELSNAKQRLEVNLQKVKHLAARKFPSLLLGVGHPLAKTLELDDYDAFSMQDFKKFHSQFYGAQNTTILISGKDCVEAAKVVKSEFEEVEPSSLSVESISLSHPISDREKNHDLLKEGALQNALRLGKILPGVDHPDYHELRILNVLLGGYFGSRLMQKIREEKGYTYGIGSSISSKASFSIMNISTEVNSKDATDALNDIRMEINRLRDEVISLQELNLVKSYVTGSLKAGFDGPLELLQRYRQLVIQNKNTSYYQDYVAKIRACTPERLKELAVKYFDPDSFYALNVGQV